MDASGEQNWARSKYPGHPSSVASGVFSRSTSPFAPSDNSSTYPLPVSTQPIRALPPAPWYHAVTDDREQDSIASRLENASLHSFLQSVKNNHPATDASSGAYSYSPPPSTATPSVAHDSRSPLAASFQPSMNGLDNASRSSTPWSRSGYPRQATTGTDYSVGYPSPLSKPIPDQEDSLDQDQDQDQDHEYSPASTPERTRTLRRTPRSRRIMSPVQLPEEDQSTTDSAFGPWKRRQSYPLHSAMSETASQHPATPPPEGESVRANTHSTPSVRSEQQEGAKHSSPPRVARSRKGYPLQKPSEGSTTGPASPPQSDQGSPSEPEHDPKSERGPEPEPENVNMSQTDQSRQVNQDLEENRVWSRRPTYPLQVTANDTNLRSSPTPPQSSTEKDSEHDAEPAPARRPPPEQPYTVKQTTPEPRTYSRQSQKNYPLQSPAAHAILSHSPTPPPSHQSEVDAEGEAKPANTESTDLAHEDSQDAPKTRIFRRPTYPLQAQVNASNATRQGLPEKRPEPKPEKEPRTGPVVEQSAEQSHGSGVTAATSQAFRRPSYPLVAWSGSENSQSTSNPPPPPSYSTVQKSQSAEDDEAPTKESEKTEPQAGEKIDTGDKVDRTKMSDDDDDDAKIDAPPRAVHTLQEPVKAPEIHVQFPSSDKVPTLNTLKPREKELASRVVGHWRRDQWRRGKYPLQSPKNITPFQRPTTPQPPDEEEEKTRKPKKIHLPKNMRAVRDSEIPASGRTIVILLDGTGDKFDDDNSNIVHLVSALKKDDSHQVTYYQAGIGTYSDGGLSTGFAAAADMAVGSGLGLHVRDAYHFLMHTYKEGDKICIFGFSRGAYTARCLAGMVHKVGLLPARNIQQIYFAYEFYANDTKIGWKQSEEFKKTFCIDVNVHLLGCFDSVASVGFIPRQLPLSSTPTSKPRYFRHAMALDERRAKFKICRHQTRNWEDIEGPAPKHISARERVVESVAPSMLRHKNQNDMPPIEDEAPPGYHKPRRFSTYYHPNVTDEEYRDLKAHDEVFETDVLEVWFAGAHADVGGGAVRNDERHKLAQIPLRWMIRQCFECNSGIIFKTKILAEFGLDVHTLWPKYERLKVPTQGPPPSMLERYGENLPPRSTRRDKLVAVNKHHDGEPLYHLHSHNDEDWTPEQVEDFYDALCKINDQLIDAPTWWILELLPVEYKVPVAPGVIKLRTGPNLGRYRGVDDMEPNVHWTVFHRMQQMGYKIQARTAPHTRWNSCV